MDLAEFERWEAWFDACRWTPREGRIFGEDSVFTMRRDL